MIQIMKHTGRFFLIGVLLLAFVLSSSAQGTTKKTISCPDCGCINEWSNDFCDNCWALLAGRKQKSQAKTGEPKTKAMADDTLKSLMNLEKDVKTRKVRATQEESGEEAEKELIDPKRLFVIPIADVLRSLEINLGGGTSFGVKKEETRPFLGHIRLGLGGVAEVEVSTLGIINELSDGSTVIPTAAFKIRFISEGKWRPAVAAALRSSLWHVEERDVPLMFAVKYQKRLSTLYLVASKTFNEVSVHAGVCISDLRIRTTTTLDDPLSPSQPEIDSTGKEYFNKNLFGPFVGLKVKLNPKTFLMMELEQIAAYKFDESTFVVSEDNIDVEWMGIVGVRFFFVNWLSLDAGVMFRSDYHGIGDAHIQTGLNVCFSLPSLGKILWGD
ncbi:MAG: hypothetical protein JSV46_02440 [Candidatus Aminicenantes bacterium]|nr:MAG: hypothetical protein JSV46_02440 [Candidatus Aminicenantes bacterium]